MSTFVELLQTSGFAHLSWGNWVMIFVGGLLIYLAIVKQYEPLLLIPIGFGTILANLPLAEMGSHSHGIINLIYESGIKTELLPPIIFLGVGVLTDFRPLLGRPLTFLLGASAQLGIFVAALGAFYFLGFTPKEAASIGIIGGADGPTSIFLASQMAPHLLGPIAVAAYSYMSLVPIIQPPVMRLLTTQKERKVRMPYSQREISKTARVLFPITVTLVVSLLSPQASPLIATLMFGNLLRESGVVERLQKAAQNEIANVTTIFLGLAIGSTMTGESFIQTDSLLILGMGLLAFIIDTAGGVLFGKLLYLITGKKFNPLIGAAGISAFPMSARIVQRVGQEDDFENFLLMHAMGANTAGQLGSVVAGGVVLTLMTGLL